MNNYASKNKNNMEEKTMKSIYFDMDGTLANFYGVPGWLNSLETYDETPYRVAEPLVDMERLSKVLNKLQQYGYRICVVSWLSRSNEGDFHERITEAKIEWLHKHLPTVNWDEVKIIAYGVPKHEVVDDPNGFLFDDDADVRAPWTGVAYDEKAIFHVLMKELHSIVNK